MGSKELQDFFVWVALLALFALTLAASYANWGPLSTAVSFAISAAKTALVAWFYMHLDREKGVTRIFSIAGIAWVAILFSLTLSDYLSRGWLPYPARWPVFVNLAPSMSEGP